MRLQLASVTQPAINRITSPHSRNRCMWVHVFFLRIALSLISDANSRGIDTSTTITTHAIQLSCGMSPAIARAVGGATRYMNVCDHAPCTEITGSRDTTPNKIPTGRGTRMAPGCGYEGGRRRWYAYPNSQPQTHMTAAKTSLKTTVQSMSRFAPRSGSAAVRCTAAVAGRRAPTCRCGCGRCARARFCRCGHCARAGSPRSHLPRRLGRPPVAPTPSERIAPAVPVAPTPDSPCPGSLASPGR
jgi:hypothetical protein